MFIILFLSTSLIISAFAVDSVLPIMDDIGLHYQIFAKDDLQLITSIYFFGIGFGQVLSGTLSDVYGRKKVILFCSVIFLFSTTLLIVSESYTVFIFGRFLQGFSAAFAQVLTRAILADLFTGDRISQKLSVITAIFGICPISAPLIGSYLSQYFGWKSVFIVLDVTLLMYFFITLFLFKETLSDDRKSSMNLQFLKSGLSHIFGNYQTVFFIFINTIGFSFLLLLLTNFPTIFIDRFGLSKIEFSLLMSLINLNIILSQILNKKMIKKRNSLFALRYAVYILTFFALSCLLLFSQMNAFLFSIHLFFFSFAFITISSNSASLAIIPQKNFAGFASSLMGAISFFMAGFLISFVVNPIIQGDFFYFILTSFIMSLIIFVSLLFIKTHKIQF